jgi:hypothetical protein
MQKIYLSSTIADERRSDGNLFLGKAISLAIALLSINSSFNAKKSLYLLAIPHF